MPEDGDFTEHESRRRADELEQICDHFESEWKRGRQPKVVDYVNRVAESQRSELLLELLNLDISYRIARGEEPVPQPYIEQLPSFRPVIERAFQEVAEHSRVGGTWPHVAPDVAEERDPEPAFAFPEIKDRYEQIVRVGKGGMGVVYRARDKLLDIDVALKFLLPGHSPSRFLREARILARLSSDYVVRVYDFKQLTGEYPILIMQWVNGEDLSETIKRHGGPMDEQRVLPWMKQTCEGMLVAAEQSVIHRDLKPSNILIDSTGRARVADFGLARGPLSTADLSGSADLMGTPLYMAPEQAEDPHAADTRSDIYSFGATFYHVLTGQAPFLGPTVFSVLIKHRTEPLVSPIVRNPQLSQRISDVLERCMAKSPAERFQTFAQVLSELNRSDIGSPWDTMDDTDLLPYLMLYRHRRDAYLHARAPFRRMDEYEFAGNRQLVILDGDISEQHVDAIVSATDQSLAMDLGVAGAIRAAAGDDVYHEARRLAPVRPGRAVVTSAGKLKTTRYIFHAVTSGYMNDTAVPPSRDLISEILACCLYHAEGLNVQSIAFPLLGAGAMGFPRDICLDTMFRFLARTLLQGVTPVQNVRIVLFPSTRSRA